MCFSFSFSIQYVGCDQLFHNFKKYCDFYSDFSVLPSSIVGANFKKTGVFKQSRSSIEGKWRDRMKNNADVTRIVTYNCRKMAICCFLLLCIKVSFRHLANLKQMLRICALPALSTNYSREKVTTAILTINLNADIVIQRVNAKYSN